MGYIRHEAMSEISTPNTDKMAQRAKELGIPYDSARAIYSEALRDGIELYFDISKERDALKDEVAQLQILIGALEAQLDEIVKDQK